MGRLGDLYGRRRMLLLGLVVFVLGSVLGALAPSMPVLILARAAQGVGGAVYPLCLAIARDSVPDERVSAAIGRLTAAFGLGTAIGFAGGGALAEYASWRWIFGVGAFVVAAATVLAWWAVPETRELATGRFDVVGAAVLMVAVVGLLSGLTTAASLGWGSWAVGLSLGVALLAAVTWAVLSRRRRDPLVDVHVFRNRGVAVANLATIGLGWALFSVFLLLPRFAETSPGAAGYGFALDPAMVGLLLLPVAAGQAAAGGLAGWISGRLSPPVLFSAGLVAVALALGLLTLVVTDAALAAPLLLLLGLGVGLGVQSGSEVATRDVAGDVAAASSALNSTVRRLAGGVGGQVSTLVLAALVLSGGAPRREAFVLCYLVAGALALVGAGLVLTDVRRLPAR